MLEIFRVMNLLIAPKKYNITDLNLPYSNQFQLSGQNEEFIYHHINQYNDLEKYEAVVRL